uniref:HMA domain-containing protein n=1 Tax=Chenopodium quinoa TaxID=63459 RepID=A0A803M293_CHEQI
MGVQGTLDYLSDLISSAKKGKKRKQLNTVNLKVTRIDCEGCAMKMKKALSGVKSVDVDMKQQKVTVTGFVEAKKVLKAAKSTKKKIELWPYVPYNMVPHPYIAGAYDKKAPANFVRKVEDSMTPLEEQYTTMFSDENPDACTIM